MPEYLSPGVYVEEVDTGAKPIEGVSTSTAAFIGIAEKGPLNEPTLITNLGDFKRTFGGHVKDSYLAYAVWGFFNNGGKRCYVVRITHDAKEAEAVFNSRAKKTLIKVKALNEGKWGDKITVSLEQASSGSTQLFLSRLAADVTDVATEIKLASTTGLSKGSKIVISDGIRAKELTAGDLVNDAKINLPPGSSVGDAYSKSNTRVYIRLARGEQKTPVKSAAGFNIGASVVFQSADPTLDPTLSPIYVILDDVSQSARELKWTKGLANPLDGAAFMDVNGVKTQLTLAAAVESGQNVAKVDSADDAKKLKKGDMVTFKDNRHTETLTVKNIAGVNITFKEEFSHGYAPGASTKVTAMTSSKTALFTDKFSGYDPATYTVTLDKGVEGLKKDDFLTVIKKDAVEPASGADVKEAEIKEVIDKHNIKLKSALTNPFQAADTKVRFCLKGGGTEVVVDSPEGFSVDNIIEIEDKDGKKRTYRITGVSNNRVSFEVLPPLENDLTDVNTKITAKQWLPTTVKSQEFRIRAVYGDNELVETFDKLSIAGTSRSYFAKGGVINDVATLIKVEDVRPQTDVGKPPGSNDDLPALASKPLAGGSEGTKNIEVGDYIGTTTISGERTGLVALEAVDDVNILAIPDIMMSFGGGKGALSPDNVELVQKAMTNHCARLKYRFAVLDSIKGQSVQEVDDWRLDNLDSKYGAIYYPWIKIHDPIKAENGSTRFVPPSGHVVGVFARTDIERGVHKAPANEILRGVIELERKVTTGEQDILNPDAINCIRAFRGLGTRIWGARCITSDPDWKYVNVRRLFIFIEQSIERGTKWVVFEPNHEPTWARVRMSVTNFLTNVWRDGALQGRKPDEAFFVRCDRTTMSQTDIDNGKLIMLIGIAPVKPAEFVIFRIGQWAGGSEVEEV